MKMVEFSRTRTASWLGLLTVTALAAPLSGCKGCGQPPALPAQTPDKAASPGKVVALPKAATETGLPAANSPSDLPTYPGPRSESVDHYRITTGFANNQGEPLPQPVALEKNQVYASVLAPDGHPIGQLDRLERGDMHGFLLARDLRQALYARADGPVKSGADARQLNFEPREGGEHALITVFRIPGQRARAVSAPVAIKGALPEVVGPGLGSLGNRAKAGHDLLQINTDPVEPVFGKPVLITAQDFDEKGAMRGEVVLPFVVIFNDQMGWGEVVEWQAGGKGVWTPPQAGDFLVLAPPTQGSQALTFRLHVAPAKAP